MLIFPFWWQLALLFRVFICLLTEYCVGFTAEWFALHWPHHSRHTQTSTSTSEISPKETQRQRHTPPLSPQADRQEVTHSSSPEPTARQTGSQTAHSQTDRKWHTPPPLSPQAGRQETDLSSLNDLTFNLAANPIPPGERTGRSSKFMTSVDYMRLWELHADRW